MKRLIVITGSTAVGKSEVAQSISKKLKCPIAVVDCVQMNKNFPLSSNWGFDAKTTAYLKNRQVSGDFDLKKAWEDLEQRKIPLLVGYNDILKTRVSTHDCVNNLKNILQKKDLDSQSPFAESDTLLIEGGSSFYLKQLLKSSNEVYSSQAWENCSFYSKVLTNRIILKHLIENLEAEIGEIEANRGKLPEDGRRKEISNSELQELKDTLKEFKALLEINESQCNILESTDWKAQDLTKPIPDFDYTSQYLLPPSNRTKRFMVRESLWQNL